MSSCSIFHVPGRGVGDMEGDLVLGVLLVNRDVKVAIDDLFKESEVTRASGLWKEGSDE